MPSLPRFQTFAFATFLWLSSAPFAQSVLVVDDDGGAGVDFTELQAAVDAAPSGATLLIKGGTYAPTVVQNKSLVLLGDPAEDPLIGGRLTIRNLDATQRVLVRELRIEGREPLVSLNNAGVVWLEKLELRDVAYAHTVLPAAVLHITNSDHVVLRDVDADGGSPTEILDRPAVHGLIASFSNVYAYASTFQGGEGFCQLVATSYAGHGAFLYESFFHAKDSVFLGGDQGNDYCETTPAGDGIWIGGDSQGSSVNLLDSQAVAGVGSFASDGNPISLWLGDLEEAVGSAIERELVLPSVVRTDELVDVTFQGLFGDAVLVFYGLQPIAFYMPLFKTGLHLPFPLSSFSLGTLDLSNEATVSFPAPLPPGFDALSVYVQSVAFNTLLPDDPIDFSAPASVVVLDAAY